MHFADAYTPYGPIRVGPAGLAFFTLRARADAGAEYMPESRARMARKARRSVSADVPPEGETAALWPTHPDGLGAWIVRARPGGGGLAAGRRRSLLPDRVGVGGGWRDGAAALVVRLEARGAAHPALDAGRTAPTSWWCSSPRRHDRALRRGGSSAAAAAPGALGLGRRAERALLPGRPRLRGEGALSARGVHAHRGQLRGPSPGALRAARGDARRTSARRACTTPRGRSAS